MAAWNSCGRPPSGVAISKLPNGSRSDSRRSAAASPRSCLPGSAPRPGCCAPPHRAASLTIRSAVTRLALWTLSTYIANRSSP